MFQEGFTEGIEPGGLIDKGEIKLLICYMLRRMDRPMSKIRINEIMTEQAIANYFEVNQAISELYRDKKLTMELIGEDEFYTIIPSITYEVDSLEMTIPRTIREKAIAGALRFYAREKSENENIVEIENTDSGCLVTFTICDGNVQMMKLTVFVADENQAQIVKNNFLEDPAGLYGSIIASLTVE